MSIVVWVTALLVAVFLASGAMKLLAWRSTRRCPGRIHILLIRQPVGY